MSLELRPARSVCEDILAHAAESAPNECCGILLGAGGEVTASRRAANVAAEPRAAFEIDPQALIDAHRAARAGGPAVVGYYHSHPGGWNVPSATDRREAAHDGAVWAIVGAGGLAFWRDGEAGFAPLSYALDDR